MANEFFHKLVIRKINESVNKLKIRFSPNYCKQSICVVRFVIVISCLQTKSLIIYYRYNLAIYILE